jgi:hypothetical protein
MLDEGIRADFELTVSREIAMWKRGEAEVDVNHEAPARAAASVTGLMVVGANPHVTVANVAAPVPAASGRIEAWIPQCSSRR